MLDDLPKDWRGVNAYVKGTGYYLANRAKFPKSSNAALNAYYDQRAISVTMMQMMYSRAQQRVDRVEQLRGAINLQTDPSKKAEMANRMAAETAAIQSDNRQMAMTEKNLASDDGDAYSKATRSEICYEFHPDGKGCK
jgi:hypothetical protein